MREVSHDAHHSVAQLGDRLADGSLVLSNIAAAAAATGFAGRGRRRAVRCYVGDAQRRVLGHQAVGPASVQRVPTRVGDEPRRVDAFLAFGFGCEKKRKFNLLINYYCYYYSFQNSIM